MIIDDLILNKIEINSKIEKLGGFSQDCQILYLVNKGCTCPKLLMNQMGILKTNLSMICRKLINKGLIEKLNVGENKKQIKYNVTQVGKNFLKEKLNKMVKKYENL